MQFDLTIEPWIPCREHGGVFVELGLLETLVRAHELESVHDASPPTTLAVHRLLLAILHRVFGPPDLAAWNELYVRGSFDERPVRDYLVAQKDRLDLLGVGRPFYQVRGLTKLYPNDGLERLVLERSSYGAAVNVFQHRPVALADSDGLTLAEAARALLAIQGFTPGGLVRKKDEPDSASAAPLNRGAFVLVRGKSVFETLMLNLLVYSPENDEPVPAKAAEDLPSWEAPELPRQLGAKEKSRRPKGWIDWLTWQSRRLELVMSEGARPVKGIVYCVGQGMDTGGGLLDPMLPYRVDKTYGIVEVLLSAERAAWRDCHSLVRSMSADGARPPAAVKQLGRFELRSVLKAQEHIVVDVLGMRGDQARIKLFRHERLSLPPQVLADPERVAAIGRATGAAEDVGRGLTYAVRDAVKAALAPGGRVPDKGDVRDGAEALGAEGMYWACLAVEFQRFLDALAQDEIEAAFASFVAAVRSTALASLRRATDALGVGAAKLKGAAIAERGLRCSLAALLANHDASTAAGQGAGP